MADYYPLLARAIGGLPNKGREARNVVFERARKALLNQLRNAEPPLREEDIAREQYSLEDAIRRLELDYAEPEVPAAEPVIEAPVVEVAAEPEVAPNEVTVPEAGHADSGYSEPVAPEPAAEISHSGDSPREADEPAVFSPEPTYPAQDATEAPLAEQPSSEAPAIEPVSPAGGRYGAARYEAAQPREPSISAAKPFSAAREPEFDDLDGYDDLVEAAAQRRAERSADDGASGRQDFTALRPSEAESGGDGLTGMTDEHHPASFEDDQPKRGRGKLIALIIVVLLAAGLGLVGFLKGDTLVAMFNGSQPPALRGVPAPTAQNAPETVKSADRIAQAPTDGSPRVSPSQPAGGTSAQTLGVAERAVLFEESAGGGDQGLQQFVGSVVWSTDNFDPGDGKAPDIGIKAEITIPDRGIKATLRLRRNQDGSIPASHIVEIQFELPPNFDLGNVANVPGIRSKASEGSQGAPLTGLAVRVAPGFFLIGLSSQEMERQRNLGMLITRNWVDLPMVFENGRRAILVLEKGLPGDQAFRQTFSAWGLPLPPQDAQPAQ